MTAKKKPAKAASAKAKPAPKKVVPGVGHNSNAGVNPEAVKIVERIMQIQAQKKALSKAERDERNRLKIEHGVLASSVQREIQLRKLDPDVRVQVETNHEDFKEMLGYQPSLDFDGAQPTTASAKAQPTEAQLAERDTAPQRRSAAPEEAAEDDLEPPAFLKRAKTEPAEETQEEEFEVEHEGDDEEDEEDESGIIEREG